MASASRDSSGASPASNIDDAKASPATPQDGPVDLPGAESRSERPALVSHLSTPAYESPMRHHHRKPSTPRQVKETLHARSEYTNSEDDGTAIHRINQYVIKQEIGRGSFGAVHRAVDQHGNEYAIKEFSKARLRKRAQSSILRRPHNRAHRGGGLNVPMHRRNASDIHDEEGGGNPLYLIREEIAIMKKLNHHNLVGLLEVLDDPTEDSLYMVMEMCKKGVVMKVEVGDRADPYTPEECRCWFRDLILGIEYLHAQGIVHRDIKPDNLLVDDDDVLKVVDFGVSEMFKKEAEMTLTKSAGSPAFLPPELCVTRHEPTSGKAVDVWSMGVTLFCLYHGRVPFEQHTVMDLYEAIKSDDPVVEPKEGDEDFHDLMVRLLEKDPEKRINMNELREHPWVTRRGTDPLLSTEENTSDLVEPPTEEEMNRAITGNLSNLLVVMKAARKFRHLLTRKRQYVTDSVLGQDAQLVQPPLSMDDDSAAPKRGFNAPKQPKVPHKPHSDESSDRGHVEQNLASQGVHRRLKPEGMGLDVLQRKDAGTGQGLSARPAFQTKIVQPTPQRPNFPFQRSPEQSSPAKNPSTTADQPQSPPESAIFDSPTDLQHSPDKTEPGAYVLGSPDHPGKGQAHDPLHEFRFLDIGPGSDEHPLPPGSPPAVCESPPAAELDIYEQAYHEEVVRIRSRTVYDRLYLTRRVEDAAGVQSEGHSGVSGWIDTTAVHGSGWAGALAGAIGDRSDRERDPKRRQTAPPNVPAAQAAVQAVLGRAKDKGWDATGKAAGRLEGAAGVAAQKMGDVASGMQAKLRAVQAESAARKEKEGSGHGEGEMGEGERADGGERS